MDKLIQARVRRWLAEPSDENAQALAAAVARSTGARPQTRKVLYSPGFGSGWYGPREFAPLITAVERGDKLTEDHPAVRQAQAEHGPFYPGGLRDLAVREVSGPYRVTEYDGSESVETLDRALDLFH